MPSRTLSGLYQRRISVPTTWARGRAGNSTYDLVDGMLRLGEVRSLGPPGGGWPGRPVQSATPTAPVGGQRQ
jgi:hypothetical protein